MPDLGLGTGHVLKVGALIKRNKIFFIYKEIQKGAIAKSFITNGLLIYD
jgi:hypothetical protein